MSDLALALRQVRFENKAFWRNPPAAFFTFVFPLMFLVIFNLLFGNQEMEISGRTTTTSTFYVPAIAAFSIVTGCYENIGLAIAFARDGGVLKRARGTPLPPWVYMTGRIAHACLVSLLLVIIVALAGVAFYGVDIPTDKLPALVFTIVVGAASFCALGFAIAAVIPNADAAPAIVNASILPLLFISDIFIPITDEAPAWVSTVANVFPVRHFSASLQAAWNPFEPGSGLRLGHLAVVALWGVAGAVVAARFFTWEPRR